MSIVFPPSPSPSPSPSSLHLSEEGVEQLRRIEYGVLIIVILLVGLFVLGCVRRRIQYTCQGGCILLIHGLVTTGLPYLVGLMRSSEIDDLPLKLFPIWTYFLLFAYVGPDTMTACTFGDNERAVGYFVSFYALWMGIFAVSFTDSKMNKDSLVPLLVLYFIVLRNISETIGALVFASKSRVLTKLAAATDNYMRNGFNNNDIEADSYIVNAGCRSIAAAVTTTQVRQCEGLLLNPAASHEVDGRLGSKRQMRSGRLKDICLARALFNILQMRFAGYSLPERSRPKMQRFVQEEILCHGGRQIQEIRVFRIIEMELEFLFDSFYTKFFYLSKASFAFQTKRLVSIGICLWFAFYELGMGVFEDRVSIFNSQIRRHSVEVEVTRALILLIAVLEAMQLCMLIFSNWTICKLICCYVREPRQTKKRVWIEKMVVFISNVNFYFSAETDEGRLSGLLKPWKRQLGQYSLLENYDRVSVLKNLTTWIPWYAWLFNHHEDGQKESPSVTLSVQVKRAIVSSLAKYRFALSRGETSLVRNLHGSDERILLQVCGMESDSSFILVWHIATSVCEHKFCSMEPFYRRGQQCGDDDVQHCSVATQLSKYCAYLVVFAPELLPGVPFDTSLKFGSVIEQARETFKGTKHMDQRCKKLEELAVMNINSEHLANDGWEIETAAVLANYLMNRVLNDPSRGWRVMAEFWVELLLYLAPIDDVTPHADWLAKGGEFITHLWALLTHAGITSRASFQTVTPTMTRSTSVV